MRILFYFFIFYVFHTSSFAQRAPSYTISGYMKDSLSTENLIGATVFNKSNLAGTTSNQYGFYSLTLPAGNVELVYSYVGCNAQVCSFRLSRDTVINIVLDRALHLQEVAITADRTARMQESVQMSKISVPVAQIKSLPATLGITDVMKTLQLMPGIQSGSEGSAGLHVRGGSPDQNLILLDGVPIYNVMHLLGFVSLFNGNAINNIEAYKGGFPARYGGRTSSVLDISMKEGNMQKFHGEGDIGILWCNLTLEGPVVKDRTSFIVSGRRAYIEPVMNAMLHAEGSGISDNIHKFGMYFYDLTAKINHRFSYKDRIYLSAYMGNDNIYTIFDFKNEYENVSSANRTHIGFQWGNFMTTFRWNHIFTNRLFSNTTLSYSRYRDIFINKEERKLLTDVNGQPVTINDFSDLLNNSGINDWIGKITFDYLPSPSHHVRFGAGAIYHTFNPGRISIRDTTGSSNYGASKRYAYEWSAYIEDDIRLTERMRTNVGLHWSVFNVGNKFYNTLQPRISARYLITPYLSAKASYSRMAQYVHMISGTYNGFPKDFWVPATELLRPQKSDLIALGFAHNYKKDYELSLEGYYKLLTDVLDFKTSAGLLSMDNLWEHKLLQGTGKSYGMELFAQKKTGEFTGWIGYTLSWTDRHFDELNGGKRFPYKYDRRHDLNIAFMQRFFRSNIWKKTELSAVWVFGSGHCMTLPVGIVDIGHPLIHGFDPRNTRQYREYGDINGYRLAPYHRLDLSIAFVKEKKWGERRWIWSAYNAYNRKNPYYVRTERTIGGRYRFMQVSLFPMIPSVSYQFKF